MTCSYQQNCGGCPFRNLETAKYRQLKLERFHNIVAKLNQPDIIINPPVFIKDGSRRRAEFTFKYQKGQLSLGFNEEKSHNLINIEVCPLLTAKLNDILPQIRVFLSEFCTLKITEKLKNRKFRTYSITSGEIWLTNADNGIDILLEIAEPIGLEHRMVICDFANAQDNMARISVQIGNKQPEVIIEKRRPFLQNSGYEVYIPAGTFLQASTAGERALIDIVMRHIGDSQGKIADLFCGVGTFSYPLATNSKNKITAVDSSAELLAGFQQSVNRNTIPNISILQRNLFKYPLDTRELKDFDIVVFDPPRAGASAQVNELANMPTADKPQKVIAVSCNPHTFVNDATTLINGGYRICEITLVDQFVYSNHSELVALFEK